MLNLKIENFGIIKDINIKIKPLTIFIGENNTNKSWVAYLLYGIFDRKLREILAEEYASEKHKKNLENPFENIVKEILNKGAIEINDFESFLKRKINIILQDLSFMFLNSFSNSEKKYIATFFSLPNEKFKNTFIELQISDSFIEKALNKFKNIGIKATSLVNDKEVMELSKEKDSKSILIEIKNKDDVPPKLLRKNIYLILLDISLNNLFNRNIVFPSERKGLSLIDSISGLLKLLDLLLEDNSKKQLNKLPRVTKAFLDFIDNMMHYTEESKYKKMIKFIETILEGKILFNKEKDKFIKFLPNNYIKNSNEEDLSIPVWTSSSMIKSLSYFALYLEKLATGNDLIIIDEPEMNLHPKAQTEFLELLTMFINGIDKDDRNLLILTTHTPYILDHLENLINAFEISRNLSIDELNQLKENFFLKTEKAFINPSDVAVYHFRKDGKIENIFNEDEKSINEETFFNVSDKILDISSEIESLKIKKLFNN